MGPSDFQVFPTSILSISPTTLSCCNFLEKLTEITVTCYTQIPVYYKQRIHMKTDIYGKTWRQRRIQMWGFWVPRMLYAPSSNKSLSRWLNSISWVLALPFSGWYHSGSRLHLLNGMVGFLAWSAPILRHLISTRSLGALVSIRCPGVVPRAHREERRQCYLSLKKFQGLRGYLWGTSKKGQPSSLLHTQLINIRTKI